MCKYNEFQRKLLQQEKHLQYIFFNLLRSEFGTWEGGGITDNFFTREMIVNKYKNDKIKKSMRTASPLR